ncbi:metallophosphoesterase [Corynebacterium sp. HMSC073D01]|uniref:metallophosphoesterase n=1 Tax=Corynebacterium sp. HMSC073D01 TaxID=1739536 RepID=UPI0008A62C9E|nr:metallophosphoesterase [Corynebacterium sp. HMSC073D01]OFO48939.1 metallophosphoesterase [Corynebacterium sp. HMSC073D01]
MSLRTIAAAGLTLSLLVTTPAYAETTDLFLGVGSDETSANLNWYMPSKQQQKVQVKDAAGKVTTVDPSEVTLTSTNAEYAAKATLTGLAPGYSYRVGSDEDGWTPWYDLTVRPQTDSWNFLFYGDPQIGAGNLATDAEGWKKTLATSTAAHPDTAFLVTAGDQVNYALAQDQYEAFFAPDQLRTYRLAVQSGNHDNDIVAFARHFNLPNASGYNYYYEYNNALIVALDSNSIDYNGMANFLRTAVANAGGGKDWIIVTFHHPPYAHSWHAFEAKPKELAQNLGPVLSDLGVDLVLNGHEHMHTRSHLMSGTTARPTDSTNLTPRGNEVLYYTANSSSGSKFYDFASSGTARHPGMTFEQSVAEGLVRPEVAYWNQDGTPDYTNVEVTPTKLTLTTYNVDDGSVVDTVTLNKTVLPPLPENPGSMTELPEDPAPTPPVDHETKVETETVVKTETKVETENETVIKTETITPDAEQTPLQLAAIITPIISILAILGSVAWTQRDQIIHLLGL